MASTNTAQQSTVAAVISGKGRQTISRKREDEAVALALSMVKLGYHKGQIKQALLQQFNSNFRLSEKIISRARSILRAEDDLTPEDARAEAAAYYREILTNPKYSEQTKLRARMRLDRLYGIDTIKIEHDTGWREILAEMGFDPEEIMQESLEETAGAHNVKTIPAHFEQDSAAAPS